MGNGTPASAVAEDARISASSAVEDTGSPLPETVCELAGAVGAAPSGYHAVAEEGTLTLDESPSSVSVLSPADTPADTSTQALCEAKGEVPSGGEGSEESSVTEHAGGRDAAQGVWAMCFGDGSVEGESDLSTSINQSSSAEEGFADDLGADDTIPLAELPDAGEGEEERDGAQELWAMCFGVEPTEAESGQGTPIRQSSSADNVRPDDTTPLAEVSDAGEGKGEEKRGGAQELWAQCFGDEQAEVESDQGTPIRQFSSADEGFADEVGADDTALLVVVPDAGEGKRDGAQELWGACFGDDDEVGPLYEDGCTQPTPSRESLGGGSLHVNGSARSSPLRLQDDDAAPGKADSDFSGRARPAAVVASGNSAGDLWNMCFGEGESECEAVGEMGSPATAEDRSHAAGVDADPEDDLDTCMFACSSLW